MNNIFNLKRFGYYAAKNYTVKGRSYLIIIALSILTLIAIIYGIGIKMNKPSHVFEMCLLEGVIIMLFVIEKSVADYRKRGTMLLSRLFPTSDMEKYVLIIFNSVLFWIIYTGIFLGLTYLFSLWPDYQHNWRAMLSTNNSVSLILNILFLQSIALFINMITKKNPLTGYLIIGAACIALTIFIRIYINTKIGYNSTAIPHYLFINSSAKISNWFVHFYVSPIPFEHTTLAKHIFLIVTTIVLWVAGYFKFKERELK